ncbi:molybdopterin biosynthesis protein [Chloropicon primus]|nr:molybdopterin biosynthesis protein [Chloropicon primus]
MAPVVSVVTISDRASQGVYKDESGPRVCEVLKEYIATECEYILTCIPDEQEELAEEKGSALIVTTGGTGPAPRDVTPEAIEKVCHKLLPGFGEEMRRASLLEGVPTAILSRQTAGILHKSLVVTLPGKPAAVRMCLNAVFPAIPYCIDLIGGPRLEGNEDVVKVFRPKPK